MQEHEDVRTTDLNDFASQVSERALAEQLSQRELPPEAIPSEVKLTEEDCECTDCGDVMPERRRRNGYRICVSCSELIEKRGRI